MKRQKVLGIGWILALVVALSLPAGGITPVMAMPVEPPETAIPAPGGEAAGAQQWSSGWEIVLPGHTRTLTHNLGGDVAEYQVQMWFLDLSAGGYGINNFGYGGIEAAGVSYGVYWQNLTSTTIEVVREPLNATADRVWVWIWKPDPAPDKCTGWLDAAQNEFTQVVHQLGGDPAEYVISVWFKDAAGRIHQQGFGGLEVAGEQRGGYWAGPTVSYIPVYRFPADPYVDQIRGCVDLPDDPPVYNSGWQAIAAGTTLTLTHGVGGNVSNYILDVEFYDVEAFGIHVVGMGGNFLDPTSLLEGAESVEQGAHWQRLTGSSIEVVRQDNDLYVDQVRVRIWQRKFWVFLPLVLRAHN